MVLEKKVEKAKKVKTHPRARTRDLELFEKEEKEPQNRIRNPALVGSISIQLRKLYTIWSKKEGALSFRLFKFKSLLSAQGRHTSTNVCKKTTYHIP